MASSRSSRRAEKDERPISDRPDPAYFGAVSRPMGTGPLRDMPRPEEIAALLAAVSQRMPNEDAAELLPAMMRTLGLSPSAVRKFCTDKYAALELSCAGCENVEACRRWLGAADHDEPAFPDFCLNAERLAVLRALL